MALAERDIRPLFADKEHLKRLLETQDALMGFVPDPTATAQRAREMMLEDGIRPEDNEFSRGIIAMREE
jgi:hypothetical protein